MDKHPCFLVSLFRFFSVVHSGHALKSKTKIQKRIQVLKKIKSKRQNWSFLPKHYKKRTRSLLWNMEGAQLCSGAALRHLAQGALNLCRVQWNLKYITAFWHQLCCLGSERSVFQQENDQKHPEMTERKTLDYSEVVFYEPSSKSCWISVWNMPFGEGAPQAWDICSSLLMSRGPKYLWTGAEVSLTLTVRVIVLIATKGCATNY